MIVRKIIKERFIYYLVDKTDIKFSRAWNGLITNATIFTYGEAEKLVTQLQNIFPYDNFDFISTKKSFAP